MKFDIVSEDCIQEEARVANKEALIKEDDQALAIHTKIKKNNQNSIRIVTRSIDLQRSFKRKNKTIRIKTTQNFNAITIIR